jgi:tyrosyl-tRNA synthetase
VTSASSALTRLSRGCVDFIEEADLLRKLGRGPVTVKVGFDPSAPDIHLGHTVVLRKMRDFQNEGHRVVFVVGDFTGMIGDPSGKKATRPQLSRAEVEANAATYTRQAFHILDPKKTAVEFNSRWLSALGAEGIVRLCGRVTVARILERDDFQKRLAARLPISLHELLYPLAQGYDSVALKADVELGGTDQLFNLLVGRDLMREEGMEPQVVMTLPLLVGLDGTEKMSKSLGNAIGIEEPPGEIFGKLMSIPDRLMWSYWELLTDVPASEIASRRGQVESGALHPRDVKAELASTVTAEYHGEAAAVAARDDFRARLLASRDPGTDRGAARRGGRHAGGGGGRAGRSRPRRLDARGAAQNRRGRADRLRVGRAPRRSGRQREDPRNREPRAAARAAVPPGRAGRAAAALSNPAAAG